MAKYISHDEKTISIMGDDNKIYKIAKNNISQDTAQKLCGGGVAGYSDGGYIDTIKKGLSDAFSDSEAKTKDYYASTGQGLTKGMNKSKAAGLARGMGYAEGGEVEEPELGFWEKAGHTLNNMVHGRDMYQNQEEELPMSQPQVPASGAPVGTATSDQTSAQGLVNPFAQSPQPQTQAMPMAAGQSDLIGQGFKQQQNAYQNAFNQGQQTQAQAMGRIDAIQRDQDQKNAVYQMQRQELVDTVKQKADKLEQAQSEYAKANIDPNKYWGSKSTGNKIGSGIAILLSGIGQGLTGQSQNGAMNIIQGAIERDIMAQKADMEKKKTGIDVANSIYGNAYRELGNTDAAHNAAMAAGLQRVQQDLAIQGAQNANIAQSAGFQNAMGELKQRQGMYQKQAVMQQLQQEQMNKLAGGSRDLNTSLLPEHVRDSLVKGEDGKWVMAQNPGAAKSVNEKLPDIDSAIHAVEELSKRTKGAQYYGTEKAKNEALLNDAAENIAKAKGMRLNEANINAVKEELGNPNAFFESKSRAKTNQILAGLRSEKDTMMRQNIPSYKGFQKKSDGGYIEGKAQVKGDHPANDTVPAMLSPGEIVIPRTVVQKGPLEIMKFIKKLGV